MLARVDDLAPTAPFTEADVEKLEMAFLQHEQDDCPVHHHFGPGVYIREVVLPTGAYVIGHRHKTPHINIMLEGRLTLFNQDGSRSELTAPQTFVGGAGRKIAYIHETVRWQNVYATDETDVETLEDTYLDKSAIWLDHARRASLVTENYSEDNEDFDAALADLHLDPLTVRLAAERSDDVAPLPPGDYKVMPGPSKINGKGLFATGVIDVNELIAPARLDGQRTPAARYINHSRMPNADAAMTETGDIYLFALRPIAGCRGGQLGEEITIDYRRFLNLTCRSN
jgi:hypothetical protein